MYAPIATKAATQGDRIQGITAVFADGFRWDGEFTAVYGDRQVAHFLGSCTYPPTQVLLHLEGGEVAHTTYLGAMMHA